MMMKLFPLFLVLAVQVSSLRLYTAHHDSEFNYVSEKCMPMDDFHKQYKDEKGAVEAIQKEIENGTGSPPKCAEISF